MKEELTNRQYQIYSVIKKFIKENGYAPTIREIGLMVGLKSTATIFDHLRRLRGKGYIEFEPKKSRTIKIKE